MTGHELLKRDFKYNFRRHNGLAIHEYHTQENLLCFVKSNNKMGFASISKREGTHAFVDVEILEIAQQWIKEYEEGLYGMEGENIDKVNESKQKDEQGEGGTV